MDNDLEGSIALSKEADISKGTFKKVRHSDLGPLRASPGRPIPKSTRSKYQMIQFLTTFNSIDFGNRNKSI